MHSFLRILLVMREDSCTLYINAAVIITTSEIPYLSITKFAYSSALNICIERQKNNWQQDLCL